jgi:hypothetical protein
MRGIREDLLETGQEFVHLRKGRWDQHPHVFARAAQSLGKREAATKGVAVGVLVTEDQDLLVGVDELLDLVVDVRILLCGGYDFVSSASPVPCGRTSFSSSAM